MREGTGEGVTYPPKAHERSEHPRSIQSFTTSVPQNLTSGDGAQVPYNTGKFQAARGRRHFTDGLLNH